MPEKKSVLEIVATLLLSAMAVIVSVSQCRIAHDQTRIMDLQTKIARQEVIPHFVITRTLEKKDAEDFYSMDKVYIQNEGQVAQDVHVDHITFLHIKLWKVGLGTRTASIPISGYYFAVVHNMIGKGLLFTLRNYLKTRSKAESHS